MSIPGQPARRDHEELHDTTKNLATSSEILRKEGIEKSGSEEPLQSILLPCFQAGSNSEITRTFGIYRRLEHLPRS